MSTTMIWRCVCGTLNDWPAAGEDRSCRGCRTHRPGIEECGPWHPTPPPDRWRRG